MKRSLKYLVALAPTFAVIPSISAAQSGAPVVAVLAFDNAAFGPGAKDYDGIGKGIMDIMITDLASNAKVRVVDRDRVQSILDEQKLNASGAIDGNTAIRVGKMFGACYSIYGSFIRDQKTGNNIITVHTTSNETGQIQNAQKITSKGDDIMGAIAEASSKFASAMDVKACTGMRSASAAPAQQGAIPVAKDAPAAASAPAASPKVEQYRQPLSKEQADHLRKTPVDARSMLLYSRALDAADHKDNTKAVELLRQVVAKVPNFGPAQDKLNALTKSGD